MITVDFIDEALTPSNSIDHRDEILALEPATNEAGRPLYMGLERARRDKVVIVYDREGKGWMRKNGMKYRVIQTYSDIAGPFPRLKGRNEQ